MHRPPYSVVFAAVIVFAAASAVLGQTNGKATSFQEFDDPASPAVTRNAHATEADALFPATVKKSEVSSAVTPARSGAVKAASKASTASEGHTASSAKVAYPVGGKTLRDVTESFKGILAALRPSNEDLRKALVAVTSPPDSPSGRPGPPWKQSPQWVLR